MKVLTGGLLIDGTGRDPIPNASVVIGDDGRITEAGALARLPLDAQVLDVGGQNDHARPDGRSRAFHAGR